MDSDKQFGALLRLLFMLCECVNEAEVQFSRCFIEGNSVTNYPWWFCNVNGMGLLLFRKTQTSKEIQYIENSVQSNKLPVGRGWFVGSAGDPKVPLSCTCVSHPSPSFTWPSRRSVKAAYPHSSSHPLLIGLYGWRRFKTTGAVLPFCSRCPWWVVWKYVLLGVIDRKSMFNDD